MTLTAKEYDAKKAELEELRRVTIAQRNTTDNALEEIDSRLAALGLRPAERSVTWTSAHDNTWYTWTYDGVNFHRVSSNGGRLNRSLAALLVDGMPTAKVIEVAALALPEGPVAWMNVYEDFADAFHMTEDRARRKACSDAIETAVPLYRAPQSQGVEVGYINADGYFTVDAGYRLAGRCKLLAGHTLIAVPTTEAK